MPDDGGVRGARPARRIRLGSAAVASRRGRLGRTVVVLLSGALVLPAPAADGPASSVAPPAGERCPATERILSRLAEARTERGSRTTRFDAAPPADLYEKAAGQIERSFVRRDGKTVQGVRVTNRPVEVIWKALNDEPHHALDGYVSVRHSEVVEGTPRGSSRVLFQYFKRAGIGRWWASRVEMSPDLFRSSGGDLWELHWKDILDSVDRTRPPFESVAADLAPLKESHGAWLLVRLAPACTLIEYYNHTEPGGFVSLAQGLLARSSVRDTLDGIVRMADEHLPEPDPEAVFVRPDGSPLD